MYLFVSLDGHYPENSFFKDYSNIELNLLFEIKLLKIIKQNKT